MRGRGRWACEAVACSSSWGLHGREGRGVGIDADSGDAVGPGGRGVAGGCQHMGDGGEGIHAGRAPSVLQQAVGCSLLGICGRVEACGRVQSSAVGVCVLQGGEGNRDLGSCQLLRSEPVQQYLQFP